MNARNRAASVCCVLSVLGRAAHLNRAHVMQRARESRGKKCVKGTEGGCEARVETEGRRRGIVSKREAEVECKGEFEDEGARSRKW